LLPFVLNPRTPPTRGSPVSLPEYLSTLVVPGITLPYSPLPKTDLVLQTFMPLNVPVSFLPAPLDFISFFNGLEKCIHHQSLLLDDEVLFLQHVLDWTYGPVFGGVYGLNIPLDDSLISWIVPNTSPGFPYTLCCGSDKETVLRKLSIESLYNDFLTTSSVLSGTLKDELRPFYKDARLFQPAPLDSIVAAIHLFGQQNQAMVHSCHQIRSGIGMETPGFDVVLMWRKLYKFANNHYDADGSQFDVHVPLWAIELVLWLRLKYSSSDMRPFVKLYYRKMYWGYLNAFGNLLAFIAQRSGQYNTASDNDIVSHMNVWLYCKFAKIPLNEILFYTCGDDLIIACDHSNFSVRDFIACSVRHGIFLEFKSYNPTPFEEATFCGTHPIFHPRDGLVYTYDESKQLGSLLWCSRKSSVDEFFQKLTSITSNLYYSPSFDWAEQVCVQYFTEVLHGVFHMKGSFRSILRQVLRARYLNLESGDLKLQAALRVLDSQNTLLSNKCL
jgi:hypothetical protein